MKQALIVVISELPYVPVQFAQSLAETYVEGREAGIEFSMYWSPQSPFSKQMAVDLLLEEKENPLDCLVFISSKLEWKYSDLIRIVNSEHLVCAAVNRLPFVPHEAYNVLLNEPKEDSELTAEVVGFDMIKLEKEVFNMTKDFAKIISKPNTENVIEQIPIYFYNSADDFGLYDEEYNFCQMLKKAEIPIVIDHSTLMLSHFPHPTVSKFGNVIRKDFIEKGFKLAEEGNVVS